MIRLVQRKLIIPRGDTGSFTIPTIAAASSSDVAIFTIFDCVTHSKVFEKSVIPTDTIITFEFTHNDTVNLPTGNYVWDIKFYKNPVYADGELVNGDEIDSYYAGYSLPSCEIRETSDNFLMNSDAPAATLKPEQLDIISAAITESQSNVEHYPYVGENNHWYLWNAETATFVDTGVRAIGLGMIEGGNPGQFFKKASELDYDVEWGDETDPTVPAWAKAAEKPTYTATEVGALPNDTFIPTNTSDLINNSNFAVDANYVHTDNNYTTEEKNKLSGIAAGAEVNVNADWNAVDGDAQILNKPTNVSAFTNDSGYLVATDIDLSVYTLTSDIPVEYNTETTGAVQTKSFIHNNNYYASTASNIGAFAEGSSTASGMFAHAEGNATTASGQFSHAEGQDTQATARWAHAEGRNTEAIAYEAHSEGDSTQANGVASHAEGYYSIASGNASHAEGSNAQAIGHSSHAEGINTYAAGAASHASGVKNISDSYDSWPEWVASTSYNIGDKVKITKIQNNNTIVIGYRCKIANNDAEFTPTNWTTDIYMNYAEIIGNGIDSSPSNAYALDWEGNGHFQGDVYVGTNADSSGGTKVAKVTDIPNIIGKADKVNGATNGNFAALDINGNLTDSGHKHNDYAGVNVIAITDTQPTAEDNKIWIMDTPASSIQIPTVSEMNAALGNKIDKVSSATNGNFAMLDANGNLTDSGHKHSDYLTSFTETDPTVPAWAKAAQKPSYTAAEVGAPTFAEMNTAIGTVIGQINSFDMAVVQELPTQDISTHTIYLVPKTGETNDVYDEYVYINDDWEMIGNTQIDLSNYATKNELPTKVSDLTDDSGHYTKPSTGIPVSDLSQSVQASLDKADSALQTAPVQSVNGQTGAVVLDAQDIGIPAGGTTGQMLVKKTDTDNDMEWASPQTVEIDPTLTISGAAADAKATGDAILNLCPVATVGLSAIVSVDDAASMAAEGLVVQIEPVQDLHGYDNPWPAGGGKNLVNIPITTLSVDGNTGNVSCALPAGTYTFAVTTSTQVAWICRIRDADGNNIITPASSASLQGRQSVTFTISQQAYFVNVYFNAATVATDFQIESGSTATSFESYANICPITGWTGANVQRTGVNVWDEEWEVGAYAFNGTKTANTDRIRAKNQIEVLAGTNYYFKIGSGNIVMFYMFFDEDGQNRSGSILQLGQDGIITTPSWAKYLLFYTAGAYGTIYNHDISINYPVTDTQYHAYSGETISITFPSSAGTVYGGYVDLVNGKLVVDKANIASYNGETLPGEWISDRDVYASGTTPTTGAQVVYTLATPITYDIEPVTLTLLRGDNNVWADTGDMTLTYGQVPVQDVQVSGTSVVSGGVANIPKATSSTLGVVKAIYQNGLATNSNGIIYTVSSSVDLNKTGSDIYRPITPSVQDSSTFYGLAKAAGDSTQSASSNAVGNYTESAKSAISEMLNGSITISGSTPVIAAKSGIRYVCGEVSTLTIETPATGIIDVVFESGSTATVLTVTPPTGMTMKWANGFDPTSLEANTTYEINVMDGIYGVVASWT